MKQRIECVNTTTPEGFAFGGHVAGLGLQINWQQGPVRDAEGHEFGVNGCFVETVLEAARQRLAFYQSTPHACGENDAAIEAIDVAMDALNSRTKRRVEAGVEGTWGMLEPAELEGNPQPKGK